MGPIFVPHTHPKFTSDTVRARKRTAWLASLESDVRQLATRYFAANPGGTEVTLAVLDGLSQPRLAQLARTTGRSMDTVKKDLGLLVVLVLIDLFGPSRVETLRHATSGKNSTRSRTARWPDLGWVARYTPHRIVSTNPWSRRCGPHDHACLLHTPAEALFHLKRRQYQIQPPHRWPQRYGARRSDIRGCRMRIETVEFSRYVLL